MSNDADTRPFLLAQKLRLMVQRAEYWLSDAPQEPINEAFSIAELTFFDYELEGLSESKSVPGVGARPVIFADGQPRGGVRVELLAKALPRRLQFEVLAAISEWQQHLDTGENQALQYMHREHDRPGTWDDRSAAWKVMRAAIKRAHESCATQLLRLAAQCEASWLVNTPVFKSDPAPPRGPRDATVNARLMDLFQRQPECQARSSGKLATHLGCGKTTVAGSRAWKSLSVVKAAAKVERLENQAKAR